MTASCRPPKPLEPRAMLSIITSRMVNPPVGKSAASAYQATLGRR